jgi:hypothetical protein
MSTVLPPQPLLAIDQVPPDVRETIAMLFTTPTWSVSKCDRMLENILRYAQVEPLTLSQKNRSAKIPIHNLLKTYRADWHWQTTCSYQTIHIFVRLLCALGILSKQSVTGQATTYLLPLDPEYCFQVTPIVLEAVDQLCDQKHTKNPKLRKKAGEIRMRLLLMAPTRQSQTNMTPQTLPLPLQYRIQQHIGNLSDALNLSHLEAVALFQKVMEICGEVLYQGSPQFIAAHAGNSARPTDFSSVFPDPVSPQGETVVDSHLQMAATESSTARVLEDSSPDVLTMESSISRILEDSSCNALAMESSDISTVGDSSAPLPEQKCSSFEHEPQQESPNKSKNLPSIASSSIDSLRSKDSLQKDVELESQTNEPWTGNEHDLSQEARRYLKLLDGPEYATPDYLNTHAGKKALGGYRNKIRRNPRLARIAAINTLLHRTFYDLTRQKKPLENAGKWFHSSFDRYADPERPMEIMGEILDWAKSAYTLEEIAWVLSQERRRQETQWQSPEPPHLPFSSCVVTYQYLRDTTSTWQTPVAEKHHDAIVPLEAPRRVPEESLDFSASPWMSRSEAEQLADEMRQQASWYLERISVRPEPPLGDHAYIVEASLMGSTFAIAYATRQNWWLDHQEQLRHRDWEEQQKGERRRTRRAPKATTSEVAV